MGTYEEQHAEAAEYAALAAEEVKAGDADRRKGNLREAADRYRDAAEAYSLAHRLALGSDLRAEVWPLLLAAEQRAREAESDAAPFFAPGNGRP